MKGEWAEAKGEQFDLTGSVIYCLGFIAIMYGFSSFSLLPAAFSTGLILSGSFGILAFIKWETRIKYPILNINLFRNNRVFVFSNLAMLINYSATYAVTFFLSLYLQYIRNLNPQSAGLVLVFQPVVQAICSPFAGRLSDRIEPRIIASMGMALNVLGLSCSFLGGNAAWSSSS
jgi:Na+/melibiose symporter-like transporter